jgi:hypothetical protein
MLGDRRHLPVCLTLTSPYLSHRRGDGQATLAERRESSVACASLTRCDTLPLVSQGREPICRLSPNSIIVSTAKSTRSADASDQCSDA